MVIYYLSDHQFRDNLHIIRYFIKILISNLYNLGSKIIGNQMISLKQIIINYF